MKYVPNQQQRDLLATAEELETEAKKLRDAEREIQTQWWAEHGASFNIESPEDFMELLRHADKDGWLPARDVLLSEMLRLHGDAFMLPQLVSTGLHPYTKTHPRVSISEEGWTLPVEELAAKVRKFFESVPVELQKEDILHVGHTRLISLYLKPASGDVWHFVWNERLIHEGTLEDALNIKLNLNVEAK